LPRSTGSPIRPSRLLSLCCSSSSSSPVGDGRRLPRGGTRRHLDVDQVLVDPDGRDDAVGPLDRGEQAVVDDDVTVQPGDAGGLPLLGELVEHRLRPATDVLRVQRGLHDRSTDVEEPPAASSR